MDKNRDALERVCMYLESSCRAYMCDINQLQSLANYKCASTDELYELEVLKTMHSILNSIRENLIREGGL